MAKELEYEIDGKMERISRGDIRSAMCTTNECLSAGFNIQLQMLADLLDSGCNGEIISLGKITGKDLKKLNEKYPGASKDMLEDAARAYHNYARNMFYI